MAPRTRRRGYDSLPVFDSPIPGNIEACLDELGVEIIRIVGDEATGRCPGHWARLGKEDRHPSWSVNLDTGIHNCFSCGFAGPFVTIVQEVLGLDRADAAEWVRERGGIERVRAVIERNRVSVRDLTDTSKQINEASLALFVDPPQKSLDARSITLRAARHFGIRWDADRKMWIIPIRDRNGKLRGWQEKGRDHFKNVPALMEKKDCLFGYEVFPDGTTPILVESPLDVVRMYTAGIQGGLSSFGAKVSQEQLDMIEAVSNNRLIVALDNPYLDPEGALQAKKIMERVGSRFSGHLRFLNYEGIEAKDPGEMTDEELHRAISSSIPHYRFRPPVEDRTVRRVRDRYRAG